MIFPGTDKEVWRERYSLPDIESPCAKCGIVFRLDVPVLIQGLAGFSSPQHECGPNFIELVMTPRTEEAKKFWNSALEPRVW